MTRAVTEAAVRYVDQLEAHMDAGGKTGPNNVRDLIQMVRELAVDLALDLQDARAEIAALKADQAQRSREIVKRFRDQWKRSAETGGSSHRQQYTAKWRACDAILAALDA